MTQIAFPFGPQIKTAQRPERHLILAKCLVVWASFFAPTSAVAQSGRYEADIRDEASGKPVEAIMQIIAPNGSPARAVGATYRAGWNLVDGTMKFRGRPGEYRFRILHGPEYSAASGGFTLDKGAEAVDIIDLPRHANLAEEGWYGGDTLCYVSAEKTQPWLRAVGLEMSASALDVQPASGSDSEPQPDQPGAWAEQGSYVDQRPFGGVTLHHWKPPAAVPDHVPAARLLVMAKQVESSSLPIHNSIQRLWARDVPVWLASGKVDSIVVLGDHLSESKVPRIEPFFDPVPGRFIGKLGPGRMIEYLYWQVLETGLRIPPSAGSGYGQAGRMLGYNRVYANTASPTREGWWRALGEGRTFVTNGPLLRAEVNGRLPGTVFHASSGKPLEIHVTAKLTVADPVDYLDVVFNGKAIYQARLDEYARQGGKIPQLEVSESGWMVVRVVTSVGDTYRLASTAPFYVEFDQTPRISGKAVEMFRDWLEKAEEDVGARDPASKAAHGPYLAAARKFWDNRAASANAP
ncbi:MAG: hypothetical protein Aurels2KO_19510 [Aureliella sp.]